MTSLQNFVFEDDAQSHAVRVVLREGEPWFVAKDVCAILGVGDASQAVEPLDDDEKGTGSIRTPARPDPSSTGSSYEQHRDMVVVSEGGLYTLILRSRQATTPGSPAHRFRKWVTAELLPQIRKTGRYTPDPAETFDWEAIGAKVQLVREARLTAGRKAAQALWSVLGLPTGLEEPPPMRGGALQGIDFVRQWLAERTAEDRSSRVQASVLYRDFEQWLAKQNGPGMTMAAFGRCMAELGQRKTTSNTVQYLGIRLKHISEMMG
ncbi:BRO family protein [Devosia sp. Naph2]|uniref:BRO-N domain-containing protein n=1 Tax=Devosia polycyclovorans TaxID=3345148 RepID=UPI0035CF967F